MRLKLLAVLVLVALQFSCSAPVVNRVVVTTGNCMTWTTNQPARCRIVTCANGICDGGVWEPEFKMAHCYILPSETEGVKILSLNMFNQKSEYEVRP